MNKSQRRLLEMQLQHIRDGGYPSEFDHEAAQREIARERAVENSLRRSEQFVTLSYRDKATAIVHRVAAVEDLIHQEAVEEARRYGREEIPTKAEAVQRFMEERGNDVPSILESVEGMAPGVSGDLLSFNQETPLRRQDARATATMKLSSVLTRLPGQVFSHVAVERAIEDASFDDDPRKTATPRAFGALLKSVTPEDKGLLIDSFNGRDNELFKLAETVDQVAAEDWKRNPEPPKFHDQTDDDLLGVLRAEEKRRNDAERFSIAPDDGRPADFEQNPKSQAAIDWMRSDIEKMDAEQAAKRPAAPAQNFDSFFKQS